MPDRARITPVCSVNYQPSPRCGSPSGLRRLLTAAYSARISRQAFAGGKEGAARRSRRQLAVCEQGRKLIAAPSGSQLREVRNRAVLAMLIGCGLRRAEIVTVRWRISNFERTTGYWQTLLARADTCGRCRFQAGSNLPLIPGSAQPICMAGFFFAPLARLTRSKIVDSPRSDLIYRLQSGCDCGFGVVAPHDLRRTCAPSTTRPEASWNRSSSTGHVSVQTTERYLGCKQRIRNPVNDQIGLEPESP